MIVLKPYSPEEFIPRSEVELIRGMFRQWTESGGRRMPPKAVLFRGERGFGKTWLSLHFHRAVFKEFDNVESLYIALFPLPPEYLADMKEKEWVVPQTSQYEETCVELMTWICEQYKIEYPRNPTLVEVRRAVVAGLEKEFQQSRFLVLILDSVFETDWQLLEMVEQNVLAPLAELANVMFIMTGRGRPYPWISPSLRVGMKEQMLKDFPIDRLTEQNAKAAELSGGSPLVGAYLVQVDDPVRALDQVANYLLEVIPSSLDRKRLREAFEALCVLDEFREGEMEIMLAAYYRSKEKDMPRDSAAVRDVRDDLLKTYLFRWEGGGFQVDASLKHVLRNYLKYQHPQLWRDLNCAAYKIYIDFARNYKQFEKAYEELAIPFKNALETSNALTECEEAMRDIQAA